MTNRILRTTLVVLALAAQAAAGFFLVRAERQKAAARDSFDHLVRDVSRAQTLVGEIRGAEAGLVATGQDPAEWAPKLAGLIQAVGDTLGKIDRASLSSESAQDLAAVTEAVAAFTKLSSHVRDLIAGEQPLTASSIVFGDAAQHLSTASAALASVATTEGQAVEREVARVSLNEAVALGGAAAWTLVVLLILLPRVAHAPAAGSTEEAPATTFGQALAGPAAADREPPGDRGFDLDLGYRAPQASAVSSLDSPHESEREVEECLRRESGLRLNMDAPVDLAAAARLCGDLARMKDGHELAGLLARAAELLDASGIVLWIADPDGSTLRPAASHGYSDHALARMKTLSGRSDNAVSVAFQTGNPQVVRGSRDKAGAVVAPVIAAGGCVGTMAAEIRHGAEASPSVQAMAAIVAAQLASLVAETSTP
jgi:hypothetical protein